jgi:3-hydroxyacyl-CoA dehydrogenase
MTQRIHRAAVLGAGTMGARIAAHFANAASCLRSISFEGAASADRNKLVVAESGRQNLSRAFFAPTCRENFRR